MVLTRAPEISNVGCNGEGRARKPETTELSDERNDRAMKSMSSRVLSMARGKVVRARERRWVTKEMGDRETADRNAKTKKRVSEGAAV